MNPFACAARAKKVSALVATIDRVSDRPPAITLRWLRGLDTSGWASLAILSACRPPSGITMVEVIAVYEARETATTHPAFLVHRCDQGHAGCYRSSCARPAPVSTPEEDVELAADAREMARAS